MAEVIVAKNCRVCDAEPVCYGSVAIGCPICGRKAYPPEPDDGTLEDAILVWNEMNRGERMSYICPKCKHVLDDEYDLVGKRYPSGLTRRQESYDRDTRTWVMDGCTVSNTLYYRCPCGANVHVKTMSRVRAVQ